MVKNQILPCLLGFVLLEMVLLLFWGFDYLISCGALCILGILHIHPVEFKAASRAILQEDGKDPSQDLGPPVHSWGSWSGTKQSVPWQKTLVRAPSR
jgi:hypothetical protein